MAVLNQVFKFLPAAKKNTTIETLLKELKENIKKLSSNEEVKKQQLELISKITDKLTCEEWDEKDYCSFYQAINQTIIETLSEHALPAINQMFSYSEVELKDSLEQIKENTKDLEIPLYPYRKLVTLEDKRQVLQVLDYNKMDSYKMIVTILSKMSTFLTSEVKKLFVEKDRNLTVELLTEIIDGKREDTVFISGFDKEFGYLKEIEVFKELYFSYRKQYMKLLKNNFKNRCQEESVYQLKKTDYYSIKRASDIKYKRLDNKVGGYYKFINQK